MTTTYEGCETQQQLIVTRYIADRAHAAQFLVSVNSFMYVTQECPVFISNCVRISDSK